MREREWSEFPGGRISCVWSDFVRERECCACAARILCRRSAASRTQDSGGARNAIETEPMSVLLTDRSSRIARILSSEKTPTFGGLCGLSKSSNTFLWPMSTGVMIRGNSAPLHIKIELNTARIGGKFSIGPRHLGGFEEKFSIGPRHLEGWFSTMENFFLKMILLPFFSSTTQRCEQFINSAVGPRWRQRARGKDPSLPTRKTQIHYLQVRPLVPNMSTSHQPEKTCASRLFRTARAPPQKNSLLHQPRHEPRHVHDVVDRLHLRDFYRTRQQLRRGCQVLWALVEDMVNRDMQHVRMGQAVQVLFVSSGAVFVSDPTTSQSYRYSTSRYCMCW